MSTFQELVEKRVEIEERLGYRFRDPTLLVRAFVHRSYFNEHAGEVEAHNERLEFLGDSVLGLLVSDFLFRTYPDQAEGKLSHMRSYLVDATSCSELLQELGLDEWVLLGKGESSNAGRGRDTILADLFEAILGAIYFDGGMEAASTFFFSHFGEKLTQLSQTPKRNWKAELQDWAQKGRQLTPVYRVLREEGPDHCKCFTIGAFLGDELLGEGKGPSKKEAEIDAAKEAISKLW